MTPLPARHRTRHRPFGMALVAAALLAWSACNLSDPTETRHFIQLQLPDSLRVGDSVEVLLSPPGDTAHRDTLWNHALASDTSLSKLPAPHYDGGDADLYIAAWHQGHLFYQTRVEYRKGLDKPKLLNILPRDSLPPLLKWQGPDSVDLVDMPRDSALAGLFPDMACLDDRDRDPGKPSLEVVEDTARVGLAWIWYRCQDRAGNLSPPRSRRLRILTLVDTVPPVIDFKPDGDTLVSWIGKSASMGTALCTDGKDPAPKLRGTGAVDLGVRGSYAYRYECKDASGNVAQRTRIIRVEREPDTVKPVITRRGPDSLVVYDGETYADAGADCIDDRDGRLPVDTHNPVDTRKRGDYVVSYACADSEGNAASALRHVRVARWPDADKPVLTLRGPDTALVFDHEVYQDSGAVCLDSRDGQLPVEMQGTIDTGKRGLQSLAFTCADSAGNTVRAERMVRVARRPDAVKPVLTLRGPDSLQVWQGSAYADSGAACLDDRDGSLPIQTAGSVNTAVLGLYTLSFQCADSASNEATRVRKVLVIRVPDAVRPVLTLRGPDSLQIWQGSAYADSGADCLDDRDGRLPVQVSGSINTALLGPQSLSFHCADSAGNQSSRIRKVLVVRAPDTVKPILALRGAGVLRTPQGSAYVDSGAICQDDRDAGLVVKTQGTVNTAVPGIYVLTYACSDSSGNVADAVTRSVTVYVPDVAPPVISLAGTDTMLVVSQAGFVDPGGTCRDSVDGVLPLTLQGITKPVTGPGWYQAGYACTDKSGNTAVKTRTLKLGLFGTYLADNGDSQIDTLNSWANVGGGAASGFVTEPGGRYFGLVRFDLSKVNKTGLKSAKLHYFTFIYGMPNVAGFRKYAFDVYRVKSSWVEGTGDWFYHDGAYRNGGDVWYQYYPLSDSMKAHVTNPAVASGITGASLAMVRDSALIKVASQSDSVYFGPWCGNPDQIPAPDHLTPVELDITDYVKSADPATDFGFVIKVHGVPAGMIFAYLNREAGGGPWAPRLMLEY